MNDFAARDKESIQPSPCALVIGDINIDVILNCSAYPEEGDDILVKTSDQRLGGSGCNTAVALSMLGISSTILGHVGNDAFGKLARHGLEESGVDTQWVFESRSGTTGWMMILVTSGGQRTIFGFRGCNGFPYQDREVSMVLANQDLLHVSGYTFLEDDQWSFIQRIMAEAHSKGITLSLDLGMEPIKKVRERIVSALPCVDHLLISELEFSTLMPEWTVRSGCQELMKHGVKSIVVKMGAQGSLLTTPEGEHFEPAFDLPGFTVFDTTGAGDCFDAGFITGLFHGLTPPESLILGNVLAYRTITCHTGMEELRHQDLLNAALLNMIQAKRSILPEFVRQPVGFHAWIEYSCISSRLTFRADGT